MLKTTRTRRFAGLAALAFSGAAILGACDGTGADLCDTINEARYDLERQIDDLGGQLRETDRDSIEYDLLEDQIDGLETLLQVKDDAARVAGCDIRIIN
jgi:hypothetical protein